MSWGQTLIKSKGFSFTEMAVVLASVTAVILAVSGTVSMVNKTRIGSITSDINKFTKAVERFQEEHGGLPGDIIDTSRLNDTNSGNGNGIIGPDETLLFWNHLSQSRQIDGNYNGTSANRPGTGVPKSKIEGGGYKVRPSNTIDLNNDNTQDVPDQAVVIELSGFSNTDNSLPIITPEDALAIDRKTDDGNPRTGDVLAEGELCVDNNGHYIRSSNEAECRLLFIISGNRSIANAPDVSGECTELGQTRQFSNSSESCPQGYVGKTIETCRVDEGNVGTWEVTEKNCIEVKCGKGYSFGDTRRLACINGMVGTQGIIEKCNENGVWEVQENDCEFVSTTTCPEENAARDKAIACNWGFSGGAIQTCTNGKWAVPAADNLCAQVTCDASNVGQATDSVVPCDSTTPVDYNGTVRQVCTIDGVWEETPVGSSCSPRYGSCNANFDTTKSIGCSTGEEGDHTLTYFENGSSDYWTTLKNTCEPITCSGNHNIGTTRVKKGAFCPDNQNGTVMEYCRINPTTGKAEWFESLSNCVSRICEQPDDNAGNAIWPTTVRNTTINPTRCVAGYEVDGAAPTRFCDADGNWSPPTGQCERKTCPPTHNFANYPTTFAGDSNVNSLSCDEASGYSQIVEGYPISDCDIDGNWTNERVPCDMSCPEYSQSDVGVAGIELWYDAADNCKIFSDVNCLNEATPGSDDVGCIKDKSPNGYNATQSTVSYKPEYTSGANGKNNLPTIKFNGSNNRLNIPSVDTFSKTTAFVVHKEDVYNTNGHCLICAEGFDSDNFVTQFYFSSSGSAKISNYLSNRLPQREYSSAYSDNTYHISIMLDDNNDAVTYKNGLIVASDNITSPANKVWGPGTIGAWTGDGSSYSYFHDGNIGEIIIYSNALTTINRQQVQTYLSDKWGITVSTLFDDAILHLDADDSSTLYRNSSCGSSASIGQTIGCWQDKSGKNNHAIQSTSSQEPLYLANAMNGKPVLRFDRSSKENLYIPNPSDFDLNGNFTFTFVMKFDEIGNYWGTFLNRGNNYAEPFDIGTYKESNSTKWRLYFDIGNGSASSLVGPESSNASITIDKDYILSFRTSGNDLHQIYINGMLNGVNTDTASPGWSNDGDDVFIGAWDDNTTEALEGEIAEIVMFPKPISVPDRENIELYLGDKWGIPTPTIQPLSCSDASTLPVSGSVLWLDGNDCSTVFLNSTCSLAVTTSGDPVGCWQDKSGNNNHAIQQLLTKQPKYLARQMNYLPSLHFKRNNEEHLYVPNSSGDDFDMNGNFTISIALRFKEIGDYWGTFLARANGNAKPFDIGTYETSNNSNWRLYYDYGRGSSYDGIESSNGSMETNKKYVLSFRTNAANDFHQIFVNGTEDGSSNSYQAITGTTDDLFIGSFDGTSDEGLYGEIAEIIIYNNALSVSNRRAVENYLGSKWGITITH